jgi:hypothetical protein
MNIRMLTINAPLGPCVSRLRGGDCISKIEPPSSIRTSPSDVVGVEGARRLRLAEDFNQGF